MPFPRGRILVAELTTHLLSQLGSFCQIGSHHLLSNSSRKTNPLPGGPLVPRRPNLANDAFLETKACRTPFAAWYELISRSGRARAIAATLSGLWGPTEPSPSTRSELF